VVQAVLDAMKPDEVVRVGGAGNKVRLPIAKCIDSQLRGALFENQLGGTFSGL
jgi:hypothetical protein